MNDRSRTIELTNRTLYSRLLYSTIALLGYLALLTVLAWLIGRILTDRYVWSQWLWWIPTPFAMLNVSIGFIAACRRSAHARRRKKRILRWLTYALAIAAYCAFIEHRYLYSKATPASSQQGLTLAHWNMSMRPYPPAEQFIKPLLVLDSDITVLTSAGLFPWDPVLVEAFGAGNPPQSFGPLTILSRMPILKIRPLVAVDGIYVILIEIDTTAKLGRPIVVYAIDLPSNPRIARMELARRVRRLLDYAEGQGDALSQPDVVIGDFNITRSSASLAIMFPHMQHAFDTAGHGYGASFHREWPLWHIDHALLSGKIKVNDYALRDCNVSRHQAQRLTLER